jgi:hypothetical protein
LRKPTSARTRVVCPRVAIEGRVTRKGGPMLEAEGRDSAMNDNEATVPQQIPHLESMVSAMRNDLKEARAELLAKPGDERLAKQVTALEHLLKELMTKVERLRRQE